MLYLGIIVGLYAYAGVTVWSMLALEMAKSEKIWSFPLILIFWWVLLPLCLFGPPNPLPRTATFTKSPPPDYNAGQSIRPLIVTRGWPLRESYIDN